MCSQREADSLLLEQTPFQTADIIIWTELPPRSVTIPLKESICPQKQTLVFKSSPLWEQWKLLSIHILSPLVVITKTPFQIYWKFTNKKWKFLDKNSDTFHISAQNIDCGYSLELPQQKCMFWGRNKKNNVYPCKPQFYYIKVGFKGDQNYIGMFLCCVSFNLFSKQ